MTCAGVNDRVRERKNHNGQPKKKKILHETDLEEIGQGGFALRFLTGYVQGEGKVVYKVAVGIEDGRFGEVGNKHVADSLFSIPCPSAISQRQTELRVTLQDLRHAVEERGELARSKDWRITLFQRLLVIL